MSRNRTALLTAISGLAVLAAMPAHAQDEKAPAAAAAPDGTDSGEDVANEIIVTAQNVRGQVDTPVPPVQELGEEDIAAYGAGSITDLIAALSPQTSSGRGRGTGGRPAILINGMRVSSFREMASFPPEAIKKVEILPEEVAQKYGFSADQRLINIILKDNYSSKIAEAEYGQPWDGGTSNWELEGTYLKIAGPSRINVHGEWENTSPLTEAERGIIQTTPPPGPGALDPADYRTLVSDSSQQELTGNWTTKLADNGSSLSVNGSYQRDKSLSLNGLNTLLVTEPIERRSLTDTVSLGSTLNAPIGGWQITGTVDASHANSRSVLDHSYDGDYDTANTINDSVTSQLTAMGTPFKLPAGDVSLTVNSGYSWNRIQSEDSRSLVGETSLTRGDLSAGFNLGVPIAERGGALGAIGDFNLNLTAGIDHLSDFGTLTNWTAGFSWGWTDNLNFQGSYFARDAAPGLSQLNAPETVTPNVQVYDLSRAETVLATVISGGNPDLTKQKQRDYRFGAQYRLPFLEGSSFSVDYFHNHSEDVSSAFPLLTPAIEAAFPGRVVRNGSGELVSIDQRPVTFAEQNSSRLRFGINLTGPFGKARQGGGGGGGGIFGAIRAAGGGGQGGGRGAGQGGTAPAAGAPAQGQAPAGGPPAGGQGGPGTFVFGGPPGGGQGGPGGAFDPQRFQEFRTKLCAEGAPTPDISELPEQMQNFMRGPDGKLDTTRFAEFKQRVCSANGQPGGGFFNPQQFIEFRAKLCAPGDMPDLSTLPPQFLDRLKGPDGQLDPARVKEFKDRICSLPAPQVAQGGQGGGQGGQGGGGQGGGGPVLIFGGPPPGGGAGGPPPGGGGGRGPGGGGFGGGPGGGGGDGRGRWFLNLNYTLELENQVLIAQGLPVLDLLHGDALSGGGVVRHSAQLQGGLFYHGLGLRYSANYSGSSDVDGSGLPGSTDLHFGSLATLDLRFFADLGQQEKLVEDVPFLKGTRVGFGVTNIFNSIRKVTDENGDVPLRYQPGLIDPQGRAFSVEFRKMF